jgi:hypothetical protein
MAGVAQLGEHSICNRTVEGPSPSARPNILRQVVFGGKLRREFGGASRGMEMKGKSNTVGTMLNPHDATRDAILRQLYVTHEKARSPKTSGLRIMELAQALKPAGLKLQEVASNLDYLVQKGWAREIIEKRSFTTPRGTTQEAEKRTYKISDLGIDHLEAASLYRRPSLSPHINISNIRGVTVVGDGNVVNTTFTDLSRVLSDVRDAILSEPQLSEDSRLDLIADVDSLQAQLQKPSPNKTVVQKLWSGIERAAAVGGVIEFVLKASELIEPLLK